MPTDPTTAVVEVLRRDSRLRHSASATISYLLDLMYYGEFQIFEQVSSSGSVDFVNLVGTKGAREDDVPPLWLVSYVSTGTEPHPGRWRSTGGDCFKPRIDERTGMLHGLGACSGKVDLVLKILAASRFRAADLARPLNIVALFGEEARLTGLRSLLDSHASRPGAALVGAPTNLELWCEHPGMISFRVDVHRKVRHRRMPPTRGIFELTVAGQSSHAQCPGLGKDALQRGLEVLETLREAGDVRVLVFDAGESPNRVPGRCLLTVATSYETLPELPPGVEAKALDDGVSLPFPIDPLLDGWLTARDAVFEASKGMGRAAENRRVARPLTDVHVGWMASGRDTMSGTITFWTGPGVEIHDLGDMLVESVQTALAGRDEIEVEIKVVQDRPALQPSVDPNSSFASAARASLSASGVPPVVTGGRLTTDGGLLTAVGAETVVFGPGRGVGDLYRDDEAIPVSHVYAAARFYEGIIERWCTRPKSERVEVQPTRLAGGR